MEALVTDEVMNCFSFRMNPCMPWARLPLAWGEPGLWREVLALGGGWLMELTYFSSDLDLLRGVCVLVISFAA